MSLGHSGSTLLGLMLGGHPRLVALGEVSHLVQPGSPWLGRTAELSCTCGRTMEECPFWGPTCASLRDSQDMSRSERYALILERFGEFFGEGVLPVDGSKILPSLRILEKIDGLEIKVLFLIRDVRSWTVSHRDLRRRAHEFRLVDLLGRKGIRGVAAYPRKMSSALFLRWYFGNRAFQRHLIEEDYSFLQLGYEELCLNPRQVMEEVCRFLEIEFTDAMLRPSGSTSHSILGNRMRVQAGKRSALLYDDRWLRRNEWLLPAALLRKVMRYNAREVYRLTDDTWER
jgi:hypothetical protein